jgi:hypothetical protein
MEDEQHLGTLGAAAAIGLPDAEQRRKQDALRHLLVVTTAMVTADYLASLRAAAYPQVDPAVGYSIIMQRPSGIPLNVDGIPCTIAVDVTPTNEPPMRGLQYLTLAIAGPLAAINAIARAAADLERWTLQEVIHRDGPSRCIVQLLVTNPQAPDPNIMFVAGRVF